jgi:predicted transcriptional regulator
MTTREELIRVVLDLSDEEAAETLRLIDKRDPLARRLDAAPLEDEEISPEEEAAAAEGRADVAAGRVVSHEEMLRRYG